MSQAQTYEDRIAHEAGEIARYLPDLSAERAEVLALNMAMRPGDFAAARHAARAYDLNQLADDINAYQAAVERAARVRTRPATTPAEFRERAERYQEVADRRAKIAAYYATRKMYAQMKAADLAEQHALLMAEGCRRAASIIEARASRFTDLARVAA